MTLMMSRRRNSSRCSTTDIRASERGIRRRKRNRRGRLGVVTVLRAAAALGLGGVLRRRFGLRRLRGLVLRAGLHVVGQPLPRLPALAKSLAEPLPDLRQPFGAE